MFTINYKDPFGIANAISLPKAMTLKSIEYNIYQIGVLVVKLWQGGAGLLIFWKLAAEANIFEHLGKLSPSI